jgi:Zn-dependent M28 family amino/carboxypeptidase
LVRQRFFPVVPQSFSFSADLATQAAKIGFQADLDRLVNDLTWLADDAREGRLAGSDAEDETGAWLSQRLDSLGLRPWTEAGLREFAQPFKSAYGTQAENIIAVLPGELESEQILIIGAHYDHLGLDENGAVYNGADDDATGVAAVLEAARILTEVDPSPKETIIFVLFSNEENGRRGSSALGKLLRSKRLAKRCQFLNLEVLGAAPGTGAYIDVWDQEVVSTSPLIAAVQTASKALRIPVIRKGRDPGSDATRLLAFGVPSVTIDTAWSEQNHPNYHQTSDDVDSIDQQGFLNAARVAVSSAWLLANGEQ